MTQPKIQHPYRVTIDVTVQASSAEEAAVQAFLMVMRRPNGVRAQTINHDNGDVQSITIQQKLLDQYRESR